MKSDLCGVIWCVAPLSTSQCSRRDEYKATPTLSLSETTSSTPLVQVPAQYCMYAKVFSEQAFHCLPQHQPWDHAIDLIPGTTFRKCSVYCLTPNETTALKDYITDHL